MGLRRTGGHALRRHRIGRHSRRRAQLALERRQCDHRQAAALAALARPCIHSMAASSGFSRRRQHPTGMLAHVTYVRRSDTHGGMPPAACDAHHLGAVARVPYAAVYTFYKAAERPKTRR